MSSKLILLANSTVRLLSMYRIAGYFRGTIFLRIAQTKHFEDIGSNNHTQTPTVERCFNVECKPIFEAQHFKSISSRK